MKSLLEFKSIVEEEKSDYSKFDTLVRAGLANKAQMQRIHKILDKMGEERPNFNNADKMIIQNLFTKMVNLISNNKQINQQARRAVKEDLDEGIDVIDTSDFKLSPSGRKVRAHRIKVGDKVDKVEEEYTEIESHQLDEAQNPGPTPPYVLLLKRKAIRLYPDGTKIALYYNKQINKFFSVPYDTPTGTAIQAEEASHDPWKDKYFGPAKIIKQKYHVKTDTKSYNVKADNEDHAHKLVTNHAPGSKIVSIEHKGRIMEEKKEEAEMDTLHKIVKDKSAQPVKFASGHTRKIDHFTASALTQVHKALNDDNKKKFADLVHKSPEHFMKASDFAFKHAK